MNRRPRRTGALAALALACAAAWPASAGVTSAGFHVQIALKPRAGLCLSESLSERTRAQVQVVCASGEFVRIEADPSRPHLGVHGGAHRYLFGGATGIGPPRLLNADALAFGGTGTVTSVRIYNAADDGQAVEMLLSF